MTGNLTPKQERFCLKYIETGNAAEAYRLSYDAENMKPVTIRRKAAELLENGKITARVRALQERALERHDVTVDTITAELEEARTKGLALNQVSAAVSASLGKAKIHGLLIEKNEHTGKDGGPIKTDSTVKIYLPHNGRDIRPAETAQLD
jgi:phage terminase small subunit